MKPIINDPFDVVVLCEESELLAAIADKDQNALSNYAMTRDLEIVRPFFDGLSSHPTIFTVIPLLPEFEYMLAQINGGNVSVMRELVREHVIAIQHGEAFEARFEKTNRLPATRLSRRTVDKIPVEGANELYQVIRQGQSRGTDVPFSLAGRWQEVLKQALLAERFR